MSNRYLFSLIALACLSMPLMLAAQQQDMGPVMPAGQGKELVQQLCIGCHTLDVVLGQKRSEQEWRTTIDRMVTYGAQFNKQEVEDMVNYLSVYYGLQPRPVPQQQTSVNTKANIETAIDNNAFAKEREVYMNKCFECHGDTMFKALRQDETAWRAAIYRMVGRGALWAQEEIDMMARYLAHIYGPAS